MIESLFKGIIIKPAIEPKISASCLIDADVFANKHPEIIDKSINVLKKEL